MSKRAGAPAFAAALLLILAAMAWSAATTQAAATHPFLEASSLDGSITPAGEFDKPCGAATDTEGDLYVANSAKGEIDVFDSEGAYLTRILDASEPCALAVDSEGNVYALDTATGDVVLFAPQSGAYPPASGQSYEAAATIDSSGAVNSIAVDPANGRLFLNETTKVVERSSVAEGSAVLNASIGEGVLSAGYGVGVWSANGYVYASDEAGVIYVFNSTGTKVRAEISGEGRPGGEYTGLPEAQIAVDQSNGHLLVFDPEEAVVDEFESTGPFVSEISHSLANAEPTVVAVDRSAGESRGRIYVTSGAGAGAEVLAFGPLPTPTHRELPSLSLLQAQAEETPAGEFKELCGLAVDSEGDVYVASRGTKAIDVFVPEGDHLHYSGTSIADNHGICGVAVDSEGNVYADREGEGTVVVYPLSSAYPFSGEAPSYGAAMTVDAMPGEVPEGIAVNPANDHLFVAHFEEILEYDSFAEGSGLLRSGIGAGLASRFTGLAVYGKTGELFAASNDVGMRGVLGIDPATGERLIFVNGANAVSKKPDGGWSGGFFAGLAVDQSNGHLYVTNPNTGEGEDTYEFEASGAYVSRLGRSVKSLANPPLAVDNTSGANDRDLFAGGGVSGPPEANAYGPVAYGEPPAAITGPLSGADGAAGTATVTGTVNPAGAAVEACRFEYVTEAEFEASGFAGAGSAPCAESAAEIGEGEAAVAVHAALSGLSDGERYHYRLFAESRYGAETGGAERFGAPEVQPASADEVLYTEAVIEAGIEPLGLATSYRCEYGPSAAYGSATAVSGLEGLGAGRARCALVALAQGTAYHFRVVASNTWGSTAGEDDSFTTLSEAAGGACPNAALRTGLSAALPDCRAYELLTPDLGALVPIDVREGGLATGEADPFAGPLAAADGEDLIFFGEGTVPGYPGNGFKAAYRSHRGAGGWTTAAASPDGAQAPTAVPGGVAPGNEYSFWRPDAGGSLAAGHYLRGPSGAYQAVGLGQGGATDLQAKGRYISEGGAHVIFSSKVALSPGAPPAGVEAVYDRPAGGLATLISTPPPGAGAATIEEFEEEDAAYQGASADGSTVAFTVGETLYVHRGGQSEAVASGDLAFGGLSADGAKLFYLSLPAPLAYSQTQRGEAFSYDVAGEAATAIGSGGKSVLVNVSADGSHVYFATTAVLVPGEENEAGEQAQAGKQNLYRWSAGAGAAFIATLAEEDIEDSGVQAQRLGYWAQGAGPLHTVRVGPALDPSRSTPDGSALLFESLANLTSYDSEGRPEVYLYAPGEGVRCLSCNPLAAPSAGATLESFGDNDLVLAPNNALSLIANLSADGQTAFFETTEALVPEDQNGLRDVYEWRGGKLALISSGKGESPSFLLGASADGRDVFFTTAASLVGADSDGGAESIYDARAGGGFAETAAAAPCQGAECREESLAPGLAPPAGAALGGRGNVKNAAHRRCPKGRRAVKRKGKRRCVAKRHRRRHRRHRHGRGKGHHRRGAKKKRHAKRTGSARGRKGR